MELKDWIGLAALIVTIVGFAFTVYRLWENNDRASAELAVRLMCDWSNYLNHVTDRCVRLVEALPNETLEAIWREKSVDMPAEQYEQVKEILTSKFTSDSIPKPPSPEVKNFSISSVHSGFIRFQWTTYLNRLESSLTAWDQGVAREVIMTIQFQQLLLHRKTLLNKLLSAINESGCFPITKDYLTQLDNRGRIKSNKRRLFRRPRRR